ncbi:MAG TPA: hypothetical protein VIU44_07095 [Gaiellaceae bacterium]
MAPAKSKKDELKAKEARQKKILIGLMAVLLLVAAIQVPKLMHRNASVAAPPPPTSATTTTTPGATTPVSVAPPSLGAAPSTTTPTAAPGSQLADTSVPPTAADGQLVQFGLFASKDPFVQQIKDIGSGGGGSGSTGGGSSSTPAKTGPTATTPTAPSAGGPFGTTPTATTPSEPMTAVALISVNGASETVPLGRDFPAAAPLFHLLSFSAGEARVTVAGGAYQDGRSALALTKGVPVTLQNTVDGSKYRLVYVGSKRIPTADVPAAPTVTAQAAATTSTTTPVATTPTTTTVG